MRKSRMLTILLCILTLVCSMFVFTACDVFGGNNNGGNNDIVGGNDDNTDDNGGNDNTGDDNTGDDNTGDDNTGNQPEVPEHVHSGIIICGECGEYLLVSESDIDFYQDVLTDVFSKNFAVVVENFEMSMTMEGSSYDAEVSIGELVIEKDENDNISAYGKGVITIDTDYTEATALDATVVIDSEYLYVKVDGTMPFETMSTFDGTYAMVPLDTVTASIEDEMDMESVSGMLEGIYQMATAWYNEGGAEIVEQLATATEPYAKAIATYMLNSMFKKVETEDGVVLSFSLEGLKNANDYLYNTTLEEILTAIVGEDPITTLREKAGELVVITLGEFIADVEADAGKDIYQIIDEAWAAFGSLIGPIANVGEEDIEEVKSYIAQASFRQMSIKSVVEMMINVDEEGNPVPVEQYVTIEMILDQAVVMLNEYKDLTIYDLVGMLMTPVVSPEINLGGDVNPNPFNAPAEEPDMLAMIKDLADTVITMYDDALSLDIYLNDKNEVTSIKYSVIYDMSEMVKTLHEFIVDMMEGVEEVNQVINAVIALDPAYESQVNYAEVVAEVKDFFEDINVTSEDVYDFVSSIYYDDWYQDLQIVLNDDGTVTLSYEEFNGSSEPSGVIENEDSVTYVRDEIWSKITETYSPEVVAAYNDCGDWLEILIPYTCSKEDYIRTYHVVATSVYGEILSKELISENPYDYENYSYSSNIGAYYNPTTDELRGGEVFISNPDGTWEYDVFSMHNFQKVGTTHYPVNCGDRGEEIYVCSDCGFTMRRFWTKEHDTDYEYELLPGSQSCEEGLYCREVCKDCGEVVYEYETWGHNFGTVKLFGPEAGDVYLEICLCGELVGGLEGDVQYMYEQYNEELGCYEIAYATNLTGGRTESYHMYFIDDELIRIDMKINWSDSRVSTIWTPNN